MVTMQNLEIPMEGVVDITEPSVFSVSIARWREGEDGESFVILIKDGEGKVVYRSEFIKPLKEDTERN